MTENPVRERPAELVHPYEDAPGPGELRHIGEDIIWLRLPLPYQLDHVNVYLLRDGATWTLVDTGIGTLQAEATWLDLFGGALAGVRIGQVLVTHFHPDHIGLAGWLCERLQVPLLASATTYLLGRALAVGPEHEMVREHVRFLMRMGLDEGTSQTLARMRAEDANRVTRLPSSYLRLLHGDNLAIGHHEFRVLSGDGHAPEQTMLYSAGSKVLIAADQVMERITPNIGVEPIELESDPLGHYLRSLRYLSSMIPDDVLVLAGHRRPFLGLPHRCQEIIDHHEARCDAIRGACSVGPRSVADLVPLLFHRTLDEHQVGLAFSETLAHANRLVRRGELTKTTLGGLFYFQARA